MFWKARTARLMTVYARINVTSSFCRDSDTFANSDSVSIISPRLSMNWSDCSVNANPWNVFLVASSRSVSLDAVAGAYAGFQFGRGWITESLTKAHVKQVDVAWSASAAKCNNNIKQPARLPNLNSNYCILSWLSCKTCIHLNNEHLKNNSYNT